MGNLHIDPGHVQGQGRHLDTGQGLGLSHQDIAPGLQDPGPTPEVLLDTGEGPHPHDGDLVHAVQDVTIGGHLHPMGAVGLGHHLLHFTGVDQGHHPHMITTDRIGKLHPPCMVITEDHLPDQGGEDPYLPTISIHKINSTGKLSFSLL